MRGVHGAAASRPATAAGARRTLRGNSFHFVPVRDVPRAPGAPCPVQNTTERFDPARSLFLRLRDRMRLHSTGTTDFSDDEVLAAKDRDGQIYADVSTKIAPDDFAVDLRKLTLSGECTRCTKRAHCGGAWHAHAEDVFTRDARRVESILGDLRGDILDIGAGEGPYARVFEDHARTNEVRYLGLDPDAARIRLLRSRYPWASYFEGTLNRLVAESGRPLFGHVVVLRSYNHLPDPANTLALAVSLLEPGGTLLVVDNVAFGLVRGREQGARAEAGPAGFEHYANDGADQAAALLDGLPLRLLERRDVTPSSSNEWLLHYTSTKETR